jgi:tetratricopeptide (TPR) repeat protein
VLLAAVVPYARTLDYGFVWDDPFVIGPHLDVRGWGDVGRIWSTPFDVLLKDTELKQTYFRPATLLSLSADRAASGDRPRGYHRTNVILYALACLFLWVAAWRLSNRPAAAAAGAVLYALHPAHPESVAFISGRTDVLAGTFLFAALAAAVGLGPRIRAAAWKLLPASLLLLPALYAKEVGLFAAPLLPLALWVKERRLSGRDALRAALPVAGACALYLATRFLVLGSNPLPNITPVQGAVAQILTSVAVVARYVPLALAPFRLSARHEIAESRAPDLPFLAGVVVLAAMGVGLVLAARRRSPWLVPLGLYAATLLPVCYVRLLSGAIVAERFLFVPTGAIAFAVALLPGALPGTGRDATARTPAAPRRGDAARARDAGPIFLLVAAVAAAASLVLLLPRVSLWRNEGTLFLSMLRDSPESPHVHAIVGGYFYRTRDLPRAARHYRRAYELNPEAPELLLNLGAAEDEMGATDSAFAHIRLLNRIAPSYGPARYALGNLFVRIDQPDSAVTAYRQAIRLMPKFYQAENNLGAVLERMGRDEEALEHYRNALAMEPGYKEARNNLERLAAERGLAP